MDAHDTVEVHQRNCDDADIRSRVLIPNSLLEVPAGDGPDQRDTFLWFGSAVV